VQTLATRLDQAEKAGQREQARGQEIGALHRQIATLESRLETAQNSATKTVAQLTGRLDRVEHGAVENHSIDQLSQRVDTLEHRNADITGSIPAQPQPTRPRDPPALPMPSETTRAVLQPARIPADGYVLRRVRDGAAVVESRAGLREVMPGDSLPGAGRVRSIERRGNEWIVITSSGVIDSRAY
jgi:BMFP domain-containing protein YqiC